MPQPSVSVIIPVHNRTEYLAEAIESVLLQSYTGSIEIIVVDDGSVEPVAPTFEKQFPAVRFLRQINRGVGSARQTGSRAASAELLAHLDDDDLWPPDSLERRVSVLQERPDVQVVAGDIAHFWPTKPARSGFYKDRFPRLTIAPRQPLSACPDAWVFERGVLVDALLLGLPFFAQTILARRDWFQSIGGWEVDSTIFTECYGFCYRATLASPLGWVNQPVAHIRRGHDQATGDTVAGREKECEGLAAWGRRLQGSDRLIVAPRLARRLFVQSLKSARRSRFASAFKIFGLGVELASLAPVEFASRPWRVGGPIVRPDLSR